MSRVDNLARYIYTRQKIIYFSRSTRFECAGKFVVFTIHPPSMWRPFVRKSFSWQTHIIYNYTFILYHINKHIVHIIILCTINNIFVKLFEYKYSDTIVLFLRTYFEYLFLYFMQIVFSTNNSFLYFSNKKLLLKMLVKVFD